MSAQLSQPTSLWNSADTVRDAAEYMGVPNLDAEVAQTLASDTEYRITKIMLLATRYMREASRTTLHTADIEHALRALDVEPIHGYSNREPVKYGEASLGASQPLYYLDDEELDLEKVINMPLPKVPREVQMTAHWLSIEGVQPAVPMNPSPNEARLHESVPKGSSAAHSLAAVGNSEGATVKPLVKHIIAKELQIYFDQVTQALTDEDERKRQSALASLKQESGLHQLLPYFVQYIQEKVTHDQRTDLTVMRSMMDLCQALLENQNLFIEPYVANLVPSIITCLMSRQLGPDASNQVPTYHLRDYAASIIGLICKRFGETSHSLKSRLAKSFLKNFIDNTKPYPTLYGAILGLSNMGTPDSIRFLILPNVKLFEEFIRDEIQGDGPKKVEAHACLRALVGAIEKLHCPEFEALISGGNAGAVNNMSSEAINEKVTDMLGPLCANELIELGDETLMKILVKIGFELS